MSNKEIERNKRLAMIGVALSRTEPFGQPPTLLEIDQWHAGALGQPRADEILSYVANDGRYFRQWQDLCESQEWLDEYSEHDVTVAAISDGRLESQPEPPAASPQIIQQAGIATKFKRLLSAPNQQWLAGVAASVITLLVIPMVFFGSANPYKELDSSVDRFQSLGLPTVAAPWTPAVRKSLSREQDDIVAFRSGIAKTIRTIGLTRENSWAEWQRQLPAEVVCPAGACEGNARQFQALGEWSVLSHVICSSGNFNEQESLLQKQGKIWQKIVKKISPPLQGSAADLLALGSRFPDVCGRAEAGLASAVLRAE